MYVSGAKAWKQVLRILLQFNGVLQLRVDTLRASTHVVRIEAFFGRDRRGAARDGT